MSHFHKLSKLSGNTVFFRYDADEYCINKGGHLAEPLTSEESNFLKNYAGKFPNVNWWLGLREAEDCKCRSTDARAAVEFEANIGNLATSILLILQFV